MSRKFIVWVETNKIGSRCERTVDLDDDDVPEDWEANGPFHDEMQDELWNSGMVEWGIKEITDD